MKIFRTLIVAALLAGLCTPSSAASSQPNPTDIRQTCVLNSCGVDIIDYPTNTPSSQTAFDGLQNIELASDGKVWFAGPGYNGAAGVVGYIKPWNKAAGIHLCDSALLTKDGFTVQPYTLIPSTQGTVDVVGANGGVLRYDPTCTSSTLLSNLGIGGNRSSARDVNGHIWAAWSSASKIKDLTSGVELANNWVADLTSGPDKNMWAVDDAHNTVIHWNPSHAVATYTVQQLNPCVPQSIASDRSRFLWITCGLADIIIRVDTSPGHIGDLAYYNVPTGGGVGLPGISVANDGVVWITDQGDLSIKAFNAVTTGTGNENINFVNMTKPEWGTVSPFLRGITNDRDNNAWFIDAQTSALGFIGMNQVGKQPTDSTVPKSGAGEVCSHSSNWTVYFKEQSAKLTSATKATLDCVATKVGKAKSIKIYGYTMTNKKSPASKAANKLLAKKRAKAVRTYLRAHGVKAKISVVAKGAVNPASVTRQSKNRRVVIIPKYLALFD